MKHYILFLLVMFALENVTYADDNTAIHFAAHAGVSNGLTLLGTDLLISQGMDKTSAFIFSGIGTLLVGASYAYIKNSGTTPMLYNTIGVGFAGLQVWSFK